ncbi:hypothetical protein AJ80_09473 [Polytolypa hystricis UAMH7299]|uniref:PRISE-like Rossmann-fold domain-containing protein n=1 Tax=Polytolypa hystricis (strain UAMH7299) TaxID=1447883 RepID=A0A2B7WQE2_POLH7|nr:hypothetical protein AJ80_09473 [Polytolypa hystricis UAMH7299]
MSQSKYSSVQSKGIYHGLPVFPENLKGLSAIVTGANGISGDHMMRVLDESPERWSNVYALSRRPPMVDRKWQTNLKHVPLDFLNSSPEEIAKALKEHGVKADYIFFFSYVQAAPKDGATLWSDAEEMTKVNVALLSNFLQALKLASITPKRFMLQTGAKNYGVHQGPTINPQTESDPRVTHLDANFYYPQEDLLEEYCKQTGAEWNVARPSYILGAVKDAAMNVVYPIGVFAAVHAHLKEKLVFPGNIDAFHMVLDLSSAMMNSYLEEWAVLDPKAGNQAFNASDSSQFTFGKFWPVLAEWYGVGYTLPEADTEYTTVEMPYKKPPRGFGPPGKVSFSYTLVQWAADPRVHAAWKEISKQHGLESDPFSNPADRGRIFAFADAAILASYPLQFNMDKSRKLGWHGMVDSIESIRSVLEDFVGLKMLPPLPK